MPAGHHTAPRKGQGHWHIMSCSSCCLVSNSSTFTPLVKVFVDSGKPCMLIYCNAQPWCHPGTTQLHRAKPVSPAHRHQGLPAKHSLSGTGPTQTLCKETQSAPTPCTAW